MGSHLKILQLNLIFALFFADSMEAGYALLNTSQNEISGSVVINEIHYDPDVKTELVEFIELYNTGPTDVDLAGWYFSDGITYQFPAGAILPVDGYIIVAQNPTHVQTKWSKASTMSVQ